MAIWDKLGQNIEVGCYIAYPHGFADRIGLRIGKVLAAEVTGQDYRLRDTYRITVWGVTDEWDHDEPRLCKSRGYLRYPRRCIVLNRERVPGTYTNLLNQVPLP